MSTSTSLKSLALITLTATATTLLIQACGGGAVAQTASDADVIEGVWESVITVKDCTSSAVFTTFRGVSVMHRGGTLSADNSQPVATRGAAFGTWKRGTGNAYTTNFVFMNFNPDNTLAGTQKVQRNLTLAADGNSLTGITAIKILDASGVVLRQACATETGVRTAF